MKHNRNTMTSSKVAKIILWVIIAGIILLPLGLFISSMFTAKHTFKSLSRSYSFSEQQTIREETYKRQNSFSYPEGDKLTPVSEKYAESVNNFAYDLYNVSNGNSNDVLNPLGLYLHLDILSHGISEQTTKDKITNILNSSTSIRDENYNAAFLSNRVKGNTDTSHIEMYNGSFLDKDYEYSDEYLNYLTEKYVEAYSLDIQKDSDINKMLEWVNSKIKNISAAKGDLSIDDDSAMFLWSTLQFDGKWCFNKDETKKDKFNPLNGSSYDVYFMNNTYYGKAYDYGDYWSFTVSMAGGYSMQFITATKNTDNIFNIIKDSNRNFLIEGKNHYKPENKGANDDYLIEISIPRFETKCEMSIKDLFIKMGLGHLYNEEKDINNNVMCGVTKTATEYFYLSDTKTKSYIHWDEDGVTATSYTFTGGAAGAAAPTSSGVQFILDSPFIYCIRDRNNLPLFLGRVDRP